MILNHSEEITVKSGETIALECQSNEPIEWRIVAVTLTCTHFSLKF